MTKISIWYVDTTSPDYRDWQLDHDSEYVICIDCGKLVPRENPLQHRCKDCHRKKPNIIRRRQRKSRNCHRNRTIVERAHRIKDGFMKPATWLRRQDKICAMCGHYCEDDASVDHKVPLWAGGAHHPSNYQVLCLKCHKMKTAGEEFWQAELKSHRI